MAQTTFVEAFKRISEFKLPARVQQGGIALADGKVVVAMEDGSILALGDAPDN